MPLLYQNRYTLYVLPNNRFFKRTSIRLHIMIKTLIALSILLFSVNICASPPPKNTLIDQSNVNQYVDYLDHTVVDLIQQGLFNITVSESFSFPQNALFLEQTLTYQGTSKIDAATGKITGYQQGLPFPEEPDSNDPHAGLKLAWDMRYAYGGDSSLVDPFIWDYKNMESGKVERTLSFIGKTLRYKHRVSLQPKPNLPRNPADIFNSIYLLAKEPFDLKNTQLLVHRLEDDSARERTWLYLSVQRRVRRLPAGQTTDSFLGSDIMIEDFLGYNGRINDMTWTYLGTQSVLAPFFRYDQIELENEAVSKDGFRFGTFHGKGKCFPNIPWQLRKTYILEARPKSAEHPLSKRIYYVDAETHIPVAGRYYDRNQKIWRIAIAGFSHPDHHLKKNEGSGVAIPSLISMIDVQANHCTTLKMKTHINHASVKQKDFTVQALRSKGK